MKVLLRAIGKSDATGILRCAEDISHDPDPVARVWSGL